MLHLLVEFLRAYILGRVSVDDLESWLVSDLQTILDKGDHAAIDLANRVDTDLIDLADGFIDEAKFCQKVKDYLQEVETVVLQATQRKAVLPGHQNTISSTSSTVWRWVQLTPVEDVRFHRAIS